MTQKEKEYEVTVYITAASKEDADNVRDEIAGRVEDMRDSGEFTNVDLSTGDLRRTGYDE